MRVLLAGSPSDRSRLRQRLEGSGLEIVAEFSTVAEARASTATADAIILAAGVEPTTGGSAVSDERLREPAGGSYLEPLTPRETQVLQLLSEGLSNKGIAHRLAISSETVKFHVSSISGK